MSTQKTPVPAAVLNFLAGRKLLSHAETLIKAAKSGTKTAARTNPIDTKHYSSSIKKVCFWLILLCPGNFSIHSKNGLKMGGWTRS